MRGNELMIETALEIKRTFRVSLSQMEREGTWERGEQDQEARR
jgi:hypothetical protein